MARCLWHRSRALHGHEKWARRGASASSASPPSCVQPAPRFPQLEQSPHQYIGVVMPDLHGELFPNDARIDQARAKGCSAGMRYTAPRTSRRVRACARRVDGTGDVAAVGMPILTET